MNEGFEVLVKGPFADLAFVNQQDVGRPVTILEIIERKGILPLIRFITASGQILHLYIDAFIAPSNWGQWMETALSRTFSTTKDLVPV